MLLYSLTTSHLPGRGNVVQTLGFFPVGVTDAGMSSRAVICLSIVATMPPAGRLRLIRRQRVFGVDAHAGPGPRLATACGIASQDGTRQRPVEAQTKAEGVVLRQERRG
jgi:hypothetical protein